MFKYEHKNFSFLYFISLLLVYDEYKPVYLTAAWSCSSVIAEFIYNSWVYLLHSLQISNVDLQRCHEIKC